MGAEKPAPIINNKGVDVMKAEEVVVTAKCTIHKKKFRNKYRNEITAYKMLAYPLLHWMVFFVFAFGFAIWISFTKWDIVTPAEFVGFQNYIDLFKTDDIFWKALWNSIIWAALTTIIPNILGLFFALILNSLKQLQTFFRTALYWPALVAATTVVLLQKNIFLSSADGLANKLLDLLNLGPVSWYDNPHIALYSLMIWTLLFGFCGPMLFYIAGLRQIPTVFYEAAYIDGAKPIGILLQITIPLLKPIIYLNVILSLIGGLKVIAPMMLITAGGPMNSTMSAMFYIYNQAFSYSNMGYASAIANIFVIIVLIITVLQYRVQGERVTFE